MEYLVFHMEGYRIGSLEKTPIHERWIRAQHATLIQRDYTGTEHWKILRLNKECEKCKLDCTKTPTCDTLAEAPVATSVG